MGSGSGVISSAWIRPLFVLANLSVGYGTTQGLPTYTFLAGRRADLPCDLNVSATEDEVSLVLWHRDENGSPLYSVDARDEPLPQAIHFPAEHMASRAYFNSSASPAHLRIENIRKDEEGMYRCRVEYRRARTETIDLYLAVVVPPTEAIIMDEFGQHLHGVIGPYNEGHPVSLICEGEGGDPSPSVRWFRGAELIDETYYVTPQGFARNEVSLPILHRRDLLTTLTCEVSNTNLTSPVSSSVSLDMYLRPTDVTITSPYQPLSAGKESEIVCVARGARPPAQISWWLDGEKLITRVAESTAEEDNLTISRLNLKPDINDNLRNLSCRGDNPQLTDSVLEDTWLINVHYLPRLKVRLNTPTPVTEGGIVSMTCEIQALPPITELEWLQDGRSLGPPSGANYTNRSLHIPSTGPEHMGLYECAGTNSEGRAVSEEVELKVLYAPRCESVRSSVYGVGRTESVSVTCEVDANPLILNFSWVLNNADRSTPLPSSQYSSNGTRSVATVSPRAPLDYGVLQCFSSNAIGNQKDPCSFRIIPAGAPEDPKNCQITNKTSQCVTLECEGGEDGGLKQLFQLEVFSTDADKFVVNVTAKTSPMFTVCSLPPNVPLVFVVYAVNNKGRSKQVVLRTNLIPVEKSDDAKEDHSTSISVIVGVIIGVAIVLILLAAVIVLGLKLQSKRSSKARTYRPDTEKSDAHLMKECKDPCVASSQGPDIIPEKSFLQERSDVTSKGCESEEETSLALSQAERSSRKYGEYQSVIYTEDPELISTPRKLRLLQEIEADVEECGITVETPLISNLPSAVQQWSDHRKEGLRLSTPV